jgi:hypothetical protein
VKNVFVYMFMSTADGNVVSHGVDSLIYEASPVCNSPKQ